MKRDIIEFIEHQDNMTNAIILTHNIDFVFLQHIVIPALRHCGRPTLTVFADEQCAANTFAYQSPVLNTIGTRYRVVPVAMEPGFRFHPKALLLSGPDKATLLIGSGNLTFGGWRENAEVWVCFESDKDSTAPFASFHIYLKEILDRIPLSGPVQDEIDEAFDGLSRPWAEKMDPPSGLFYRIGKGLPILEQIVQASGEGPIKKLTVCSPYFDNDTIALDDLINGLKPEKVDILVQKKHPGLPNRAVEKLPHEAEVIPVGFIRKDAKGVERESFIHAKFYGISKETHTLVFAGSANCSRAALTIPGRSGNAELLASQSLGMDQFHEIYLDEIPRVEGNLILPDPSENDDTKEQSQSIRILAARYEGGLLRIAYACTEGIEIRRCFVDAEPFPFTVEKSGIGTVELTRPPARVILEGIRLNDSIRSHEGWVDIEQELRSTARVRSVAFAIRDGVRAANWGIGAWKDILDVFCKHLQYMPSRSSTLEHVISERRAKQLANFTAQDVFSSGYGLPNFGSAMNVGFTEDRILSLQQLLIRWFGIIERDEPPIEDVTQFNNAEEDEDDVVDLPEKTQVRKEKTTAQKPINEHDRVKAKKSVEQVLKAMTSEEFLSHRSPELLAADLKIAAILLCAGFKQNWIDESDFFEATRLIWSSLFFSSSKQSDRGWLECRWLTAENPDDFKFRMASPELSAALAAWIMTAPQDIRTLDNVVFTLAKTLAVARLPWLWQAGELEMIGQEIGAMLTYSGGILSADNLKRFEQAWISLMRTGEALRALEEALKGHSPLELRERIRQDQIERGELLWQGRSGYCVASCSCLRSWKENVPVLRLQGAQKESSFDPSFLIPVRSLLSSDMLPQNERFGIPQRNCLSKMISELSKFIF
ncbi:MAG TPA: hypothetical protein PK528_05125 [Syntrophorhabdus sp.]|nr:hypothetical protein [Syntrophorhabdus sp.]